VVALIVGQGLLFGSISVLEYGIAGLGGILPVCCGLRGTHAAEEFRA